MRPGISTACFYPSSTEDSLRAVAEIGPPCAEIFLNAAQELEPAYLEGLRGLADQHGIRIISVHPYLSILEPMLFFSQYKRRFEEGRELYKKFYRAVRILGADALVFHGNYRQSPLPWEEYFRRFQILWEDARSCGVELCQENVERCSSSSAAFFAQMNKALPKAQYILDIKQVIRADENLFHMAQTMAGRIKCIHMSDHNAVNDCMVPGRGTFNIGKFLTAVGKNGFDGAVIVELYRENFADIVELSRGFAHLSTVLSTLS